MLLPKGQERICVVMVVVVCFVSGSDLSLVVVDGV